MSSFTPSLLVLGLLVSSQLPACGRDEPSVSVATAVAPGNVQATVNGVPITVADVRFLAKARSVEEAAAAKIDPAVVETIIREELLAQKAVQLGLDADPKLQEEIDALQAQVRALRRQRLAEKFIRHEVTDKVVVDTAASRKFFGDNEARIHTDLHVFQILERDERKIREAHAAVLAGTPFEEVARRQMPNLPEGSKPWDLGFLSWKQVPEQWQAVAYTMPLGKPSDVIRGPSNRFWIIQIVEKRVNASKFEDVQPILADDLKTALMAARRAQVEKELLDAAKIVRKP